MARIEGKCSCDTIGGKDFDTCTCRSKEGSKKTQWVDALSSLCRFCETEHVGRGALHSRWGPNRG